MIIENNRFYHTGMFPVLIADDAGNWFESGPVQDVTIRNNRFEECGYNSGSGAISITPENNQLVPGKYVHRNIRIINNTFRLVNSEVLLARSVDGLRFSGNRILTRPGAGVPAGAIIRLTACKAVEITKNNPAAAGLNKVVVSGMAADDIRTDWK